MTTSFALDEDLRLICEMVEGFATDRLRPEIRRFEADRRVTEAAVADFNEIGLDGLQIPESLGGADLGMLARVQVNQRLGAADAGAALALDRLGPALLAVRAVGGERAVGQYLTRVMEDPEARVLLVLEQASTLTLTRGWVQGEVPWVVADRADLVVGLGPQGCWIAAGTAVELTSTTALGLRAAGASRLVLDGPVLASWTNPEGAEGALAQVRLYYASLLLGVLYDSTRFSRAYAQERVAFGQPIAHHQGLAFLIVDMFAAVERARLLIEDAAWRIDAGEPGAPTLAASAFVEVVEAARFVGPNGVQILGGHGFMADFPMEKAMREAQALGLLAGGVDLAREDAGQGLARLDREFSI